MLWSATSPWLSDVIERLSEHQINPETMTDYLESFRYGSVPHGGCGFGLERIVMLYLDLDLENIRMTSMCPREPNRLRPWI